MDSGRSQEWADELLEISEQHFVYRIVLEMERVDSVDGEMLDRLEAVRERLAEHGGALRLCGLPEEVVRASDVAKHGGLCVHASRHGAVVGDPDEEFTPARSEFSAPSQLK